MAKIRLEKMRIPPGMSQEKKFEYVEQYINSLEGELEYILMNISNENINVSDITGGEDNVSYTFKQRK